MDALQSLLLIYGHICHTTYCMSLPVSKESPNGLVVKFALALYP